jgi:hypothetical protein
MMPRAWWQEPHVYAIFFGQKPEFFGLLNLEGTACGHPEP